MDNNYNGQQNQYQNQNYGNMPQQPVYQQDYTNGQQYNTPYMDNYQSAPVVLTGGVSQKPNIIMGIVGALVAGVVGTLLWIFITTLTGKLFVLVAAGMSFGVLALYSKLAKGMDVVGAIICLVVICIGIYFATRYSHILILADELGCSNSEAEMWFDLACDMDSDTQFAYMKNMIISYVMGIACTFGYFKKG